MAERTNLKICGITNLEDARYASGAMVDYLGFIFYEKSPRYIEPAQAGAIINWLEGPKKVGVFVNQPLDEVNSTAKQTGIDLVQLHGSESVEYCELIEKPVMKVIHITEESTTESVIESVKSYADVADYFLFDTKLGDQWGGTGTTFDWSVLSETSIPKPFFLSGGINVDNLKSAVSTVKPYGIDVSSSLEEEPGLKDFEKVEAFMDEMRSIWDSEEG
jgi:phosphoribosylanthranilate isomerase